MSRSNSYGRNEEQQQGNVHGSCDDDSFMPHRSCDDSTYDIYLHENQSGRTLDLATNIETAFVVNEARSKDNRNREFDSFSCETPPGYEESLYRQRLLKLHNRSSSYVSPSPMPEKVLEKQVELSAKAKLVFEESLRQYNDKHHESVTTETPPPLPPKTDRPPLPPKQRSRRSTDHESSDDQTYVNSAELRSSSHIRVPNRTRLNISNTNARQSSISSDEKESNEFVYGSYFSGGGKGGSKISVPIVPELNSEKVKHPPTLPPKDTQGVTRVAEVSDTRQVKKKSGVTTTRIVGTNAKPMKSVETQTDENDFYILYPDCENESYTQTDSEYSPESNRSISPVEYPSPAKSDQQNFFSRGPSEYLASPARTLFERPVSAQSACLRQAGRRRLEPVQSVPARNRGDPLIAGEINWSVSQLRTLFNQGLASHGEDALNSPSHKQLLERNTVFTVK